MTLNANQQNALSDIEGYLAARQDRGDQVAKGLRDLVRKAFGRFSGGKATLAERRAKRDEAAQAAFEDFDFGSDVAVTDFSGWEYIEPGSEWSRKVYVEQPAEDDGPAPRWTLTFVVVFDGESERLRDVYARTDKGNEWGWVGRATQLMLARGRSIEAGKAAVDAHTKDLGIQGGPETQALQLLASVADWAEHQGLHFAELAKEAQEMERYATASRGERIRFRYQQVLESGDLWVSSEVYTGSLDEAKEGVVLGLVKGQPRAAVEVPSGRVLHAVDGDGVPGVAATARFHRPG